MSRTLQQALFNDDGPVEVSKVEIEILDNGSCRWHLFDDQSKRMYSAIAKRDNIPAMLEATGTIVRGMAGLRA